MRKYKIFVSGVQKELRDERHAVKELISENSLLDEYLSVFLFEDSSAKSKSTKTVCEDEVRGSDIYLGILGNEYGTVDKNGYSATEKEFRIAQENDEEILFYIKGNEDDRRDKKIQKLISEIRNSETGYKYKRFNTIEDLRNNIYESLLGFLRDKGIVGRTAFDRVICENTTFEDIDEEKVRWFLRVARDKRKYVLEPDTPTEDAFTHLNLLNNNKLTNSAILLFGKNPHRFHLQAKVKCIQFPGTEVEKPFSSYHIYDGNLFEQVDKSAAFVLDAIRLPVIQQEHTVQAKRPPEIPTFAIQEAIVNAVAHRDYNSTASVQVMVFVDRVEIWNPGSLPPSLTIDALKKPHTSYPNNPLLAESLYLAAYIQGAGSGTIEMMKQCRAQGSPEPEFVSIRGVEFRTILGRDIFTENMLAKLGLNERQIKAVKYVKEKGRISNKEYKKLTDVSKPTATRDLSELVEKDIFDIMGKGKRNICYFLTFIKPKMSQKQSK